MKFITAILVTYISLLTVSPALCGLASMLKQVDLCCAADNEKKCSKEPSDNKEQSDQSDSKTPCIPCCSVQNCLCYFVGVPQYDLAVQLITVAQKIRVKNENVFSNYLSNCWHPPKLV
jgi:hypothetical protein